MKTKLLGVAALLFGYVLPALAAGEPKMLVVKALVNDKGEEVSFTVTPVDFDKVVLDEATAKEVNALAEKNASEAIAINLNDEQTSEDVADAHRGGWGGGFRGGHWGGYRGGHWGGHWGGYRGGHWGGYHHHHGYWGRRFNYGRYFGYGRNYYYNAYPYYGGYYNYGYPYYYYNYYTYPYNYYYYYNPYYYGGYGY